MNLIRKTSEFNVHKLYTTSLLQSYAAVELFGAALEFYYLKELTEIFL